MTLEILLFKGLFGSHKSLTAWATVFVDTMLTMTTSDMGHRVCLV
jgi:hypothetical protein